MTPVCHQADRQHDQRQDGVGGEFGEGAARFAREIGAETAQNLTLSTRKLWVERLRSVGETPASIRRRVKLLPVVRKTVREERGTVNFLALDQRGDMASAVTTSGWAYKYPGRVGDSPIVGAGNYSDSRYGAAACTGYGELAIRNVTAKTAVDRLASGMPPDMVARAAIADANEHEDAAFNIVVLSPKGVHASATNREGRRYSWMTTRMDEPEVQARMLVKRTARRSRSAGTSRRRNRPDRSARAAACLGRNRRSNKQDPRGSCSSTCVHRRRAATRSTLANSITRSHSTGRTLTRLPAI